MVSPFLKDRYISYISIQFKKDIFNHLFSGPFLVITRKPVSVIQSHRPEHFAANLPCGRVAIEEGMPKDTMDALQKMGHPLYEVKGYERALFGRGQVILRDAESGVLCAGSDPRADGCAGSV